MRRAGLEAAVVYTADQILDLARCATQGKKQPACLVLTGLLPLLSLPAGHAHAYRKTALNLSQVTYALGNVTSTIRLRRASETRCEHRSNSTRIAIAAGRIIVLSLCFRELGDIFLIAVQWCREVFFALGRIDDINRIACNFSKRVLADLLTAVARSELKTSPIVHDAYTVDSSRRLWSPSRTWTRQYSIQKLVQNTLKVPNASCPSCVPGYSVSPK